MKKLTTEKGEFTNYSSIVKNSDHWDCDGIIIPFTVAGSEGVIEEYIHIPIQTVEVPSSVTPRQARLALLQVTLLDEVELLLANDKAMQIWWEYSLEINRNDEHIATMGLALGLSSLQLDDLFILASTL